MQFKPTQLFYKLFALVVVLLALNGCSEPQLNPLAQNDKVLAFGDSLTAGYGVKKQHSYPAVLSTLIDRPVINAGISGETTAEGLARFAQVLEAEQPKLVILIEGGNDFLQNKPAGETYKNLKQMIEIAQTQQVQVVLVGVPPKKLLAGSHELYEQLAEEFQLPLEENIIPSLLRRPSMKSDYVHFNQAGYAELAKAVEALLKNTGAI